MSVWSSIGRRNQIGVLVFVMLLAVAAGAGGCYAHRRPAALNAEEQKLLDATPLPFTVSVVPWNSEPGNQSGRDPEQYAEALAELVADSAAFRASRLEDRPSPDADLVAISNGVRCNASVIPLFTILSAGLIPTVFDDEDCHGMVVRSSKPSTAPPVEIGVRHKGQVVTGWAALVFGAMPGWSWGSGGDDRRYEERFRLEVIRHQAEIENLVNSHPPDPPDVKPSQ
jgi:hypothetical protein